VRWGQGRFAPRAEARASTRGFARGRVATGLAVLRGLRGGFYRHGDIVVVVTGLAVEFSPKFS
jgi:hypothetical protein